MSLGISMMAMVAVIMGILVVTLGYHCMPYRPLPAHKPRFQIYPKYRFGFSSREGVVANLQKLGFERDPAPGLFVTGVGWGSIGTENTLLHVQLAPDRNEGVIHAPGAGIIFDTGDLWTIANDIVTE